MNLIEYLFSESDTAAQELSTLEAPAVNEVTKEQLADASAERALELADDIASTEALTEEQYTEVAERVASYIYTSALAELQIAFAAQGVLDLFSEDAQAEFAESL